MSLLDHDLYGDPDEFREQYGSDTPTLEQICALQVRVLNNRGGGHSSPA